MVPPLHKCLLKLCVALSLLGPSAAIAETSMTLYGVIDLSLYSQNISRAAGNWGPAINGSQTGMTSGVLSGSRWGIKGTEQLSDQWSVQFVLEAGVNAQDGTLGQGGLGFGRQATISVASSDWGSLQLGRAGSLAYSYLVPFDPFSISGSQAGLGTSFGSANGVRPDNLILYQSAVMRGLQASIGYSFNTGFSAIYQNNPTTSLQPGTNFFGTTANMRMLTAAIRYNSGPLALLVAYDAVYAASKVVTSSSQTVANNNSAIPKAWLAAGSYDFKTVKLSAVVGQTFDGAFFGQNAGAGGYSAPFNTVSDGANILFAQGAKTTQFALGAVVPVSARGKILLSWQTQQISQQLNLDRDPANQQVYSAAYVYSISKRTDLYVWGSYGSNHQTVSNAKSSVVGTGIRHFF